MVSPRNAVPGFEPKVPETLPNSFLGMGTGGEVQEVLLVGDRRVGVPGQMVGFRASLLHCGSQDRTAAGEREDPGFATWRFPLSRQSRNAPFYEPEKKPC